MAATGYSPIQLYYSTTASAAPTAGNLASGELAINITDGKLYYKDNAGAVQLLSTSTTANGTANGVLYLNGSKVATAGTALVFDGTNFAIGLATPDARLNVNGYTGNGTLRIGGAATGESVLYFANAASGTGSYAGYLQYLHSSNAMVFGAASAEAMRLTSTGLGIGTSSPGYKLDVNGAANFANGVYHRIGGTPFVATSANYTYFYANTNGIIWRNSADTVNQIVLSPDGNLGLGVTPSAWDTSAVRALQIGAQAAFAAESTVAHVITNAYYNAGWKYIGTGNATDYYQLNGAHVWRTSASGTAGNAITFTQAMTLDASGNLGVGTTSPVSKLHIESSSAESFQIGYSSTKRSRMGTTSAGDLQIYAYETGVGYHNILLASDAGSVAGNVGIGTSSPGHKLDIAGASGVAINIANTDDSNRGGRIVVAGSSASGTVAFNTTSSGYGITFGIDSTEKMRLDTSGNLGIGTSSPTSKLESYHTSTVPSLSSASGSGLSVRGSSTVRLNFGSDPASPYGAWIQSSDGAGTAYAINLNPLGGNVGIGTSSPGAKLDVQVASGSQSKMRLSDSAGRWLEIAGASSSTDPYFATDAARPISFNNGTAQATQMVLSASGNLGLGVTPSAWNNSIKALQVNNAALASFTNGGNVQTWLANNAYYDNATGWLYKNSSVGAALYAQSFNGSHNWNIAPSGTAGNAITFTQAMTLDASGNLILGSTTSLGKLSVWSAANGDILAGFRCAGTGTQRGLYISGDNSTGVVKLDVTGSAGGTLAFATGGTETARIDTSGNLLVGTTDTSGANTTGFEFFYGSGSSRLYLGHVTGTVTGTYYHAFNYAGTTIGSITQSGTTAVLYNVTSDQRLKENIADADSASVLIDSLQVRKFDWKSDGNHQRYGFVAQELVTVAPEAVHQPADPEEMMAVDYSKLVPMLVKEIQSLRKRLADAGIA